MPRSLALYRSAFVAKELAFSMGLIINELVALFAEMDDLLFSCGLI